MNDTLKLKVANYNREISLQLKELCAPLFGCFKEYSIGYTRQYHDGRRIIIETEGNWLDLKLNSYLHDEVLIQNLENARIHTQKEYVYILSGEPKNIIHEQLFNFNIWNGVNLHYSNEEFEEAFHFGTTRDNSELISLYLNKRDLFTYLVLYIRERFSEIKIQQAPLLINKKNSLQPIIIDNALLDENIYTANIQNFLKQSPIKKYYIHNYDFYLTKRELDCIYYLRKGFTIKHIAKSLNISPRTVEYYINEVRKKVGLHYKNDILCIFQNADFLNCWIPH